MYKESILIYTDGACRNNQSKNNIGAIGILVIQGEKKLEIKKAFKNTTNNKMEILACIKGLEAVNTFNIPIEIYTDSQYVVGTMTLGWRRNTNTELWDQLDALIRKFSSVEFIKVKGHSSDFNNDYVDKLCNQAMDELK